MNDIERGPTELEPPPDEWDEAHQQIKFNEQVATETRRLKIRDAARERLRAERAAAEGLPPFDAGLLADILARPPEPKHRAEGIIPADGGTLIVAQRKTGKTSLQLNLARSALLGEDFLGKFPVTPLTGRVAFLNFEVSGQTVAAWANDLSIPHDRMFLVNLRGRRNPLASPEDSTALAQKLREMETEMLIIDPFGRAFTGTNQNDPGEVGGFLADLDRFGRGAVGARDIVLAAHAGWNGERSRGSTALEDWADTIINVTRGEDGHRYLRAEGRDVLVAEDRISMNETTRLLTLDGAGSRRSAAEYSRREALIPLVLEVLHEHHPQFVSASQLDTAIAKMIKDGEADIRHSKGDAKNAAQMLERPDRGSLLVSKAGPRNSRLFGFAPGVNPDSLTSLTSPDLPAGKPNDLPNLPYREGGRDREDKTATPPQPNGDHAA